VQLEAPVAAPGALSRVDTLRARERPPRTRVTAPPSLPRSVVTELFAKAGKSVTDALCRNDFASARAKVIAYRGALEGCGLAEPDEA